MEIKIIEEDKNKIIFELKGASHTICNVLKDEMRSDNKVKTATYRIGHPLINVPRFTVETDGSDPRKAVIDAAQRIKKLVEKFEKDFSA